MQAVIHLTQNDLDFFLKHSKESFQPFYDEYSYIETYSNVLDMLRKDANTCLEYLELIDLVHRKCFEVRYAYDEIFSKHVKGFINQFYYSTKKLVNIDEKEFSFIFYDYYLANNYEGSRSYPTKYLIEDNFEDSIMIDALARQAEVIKEELHYEHIREISQMKDLVEKYPQEALECLLKK